MVTGVVTGEDGRLVATCCDGSGGLGDSLLLVELCSSDLVSSITGWGAGNSY